MTDLAQHLAESRYTNTAKCLIILAVSGRPLHTPELKRMGYEHGLRKIQSWNISALFRGTPGRVAHTSEGWRLLPKGRLYLEEIGFSAEDEDVQRIRSPLRLLAEGIKTQGFKSYLEEAADCFDSRCYRATTILSWCASLEVLKVNLIGPNFPQFSGAFDHQFPKRAGELRSVADLEKVKEADILLVLEKAGLVGKTLKRQLEARLDLRNAAGHPNGVSIGRLQAAAHVEFLLDHVLHPYAA
jgi:hypothetical protein